MASQPPRRSDGVPILHDFLTFRRDPLAFWRETGDIAPVTRVRFGPTIEYWVITEPDFLQHILQKRAKFYPRERRLMRINRANAPELLFNTDNWEEWLWRRRLMQPAFHRQQIAGFAEAMVDETQKLAGEWPDGATINLEHAMKTLTMRIIARTMFSSDVRQKTDMMQYSYELSSLVAFERASAPVALPLWLPLPKFRRHRAAIDARTDFLYEIVQERLKTGAVKGDLLDTLIAARLEEDGRSLTLDDLVWEMSGIVFAGHDTTAMTLTWLLYTLSQHPSIEAQLREEMDTVLNGRPATLADLPHMPLTERVILETLRLYPPVYLTIREADEDDQFGDYIIPKGTSFVVNIRGMHRSAAHWDEPDRFDPDRFLPQRSAGRHKFAYLPFLQGPRKCMGDSFAMMEMQLVLPTLLQAAQFGYTQPQPPTAVASFVLETKGGLPMQVRQLEQGLTQEA